MTRSRRIAALALLAAAALAAPIQAAAAPLPGSGLASQTGAQAADEGDVVLSGTLRAMVVDDFTDEREQTVYSIEDASGTTLLSVSGGEVGRLSGARVHVRGKRQADGTVAIAAGTVVVDETAAHNPDALGRGMGASSAVPAAAGTTRTVAVIVAKYSDQSGYPVTVAQATQTFSTANASVKSYFETTSRGRVSTNTTVLGQWDLGIAQCPWSFSDSVNRALSVASGYGYDLSSYDHVVLWTKPPCGAGWAGIAYMPGRYVQLVDDWTASSYDKPAISTIVASHELEHNLGLAHANGLSCTDGAGHQVVLASASNCTPVVYQDWYSTMGGAGLPNHALLDAERLGSLGWLDSGESQTVTSAGTYSLVPTYSSSAGLRLLRIPRPTPVTAGTLAGVWTIELRSNLTGSAFDQLSTSPFSKAATGVTIRYSETPSGSLYAQSLLVDSVVGGSTPNFTDAPFQVGTIFTDSTGGISVSVDSVSGSGATVTIGDTQAPSAPQSLVATPLPGDGVRLDWQAATDNLGVVHYRVYRDGSQIAELPGGTLTYTDSSPGSSGLHTYSVTAVDGSGSESAAAYASARAAYVPVIPNRLEDSRLGTHLSSKVPRSFQVTDRSADPAKNIPAGAVAVTGNLTAVNQTSVGYLAITPDKPAAAPTTSTLNFPAWDTRANGVTIPLGAGGVLWVTFVGTAGSRADFIFDVTGYFVGSSSAATYKQLTPNRILDTRSASKIGSTARLASDSPASFQVTDQSSDPARNVPSDAVAVVGNLTAVNQTSKGYFALTPDRPAARPTTSTINFPAGDTRANNVIAPLGAGGVLWVTFVGTNGARADVLFDVTGYFIPGTSGAMFVPMTPHRPLDSRYHVGLSSSLANGVPAHFSVNDPSADPSQWVPDGAVAIAGNLTAVREGARGNYALTPDQPAGNPTTSTVNFLYYDTRANGVTVPVSGDLTLWVTFSAWGNVRGDVILDIVGYYTTS
jgi:hypothetical protein